MKKVKFLELDISYLQSLLEDHSANTIYSEAKITDKNGNLVNGALLTKDIKYYLNGQWYQITNDVSPEHLVTLYKILSKLTGEESIVMEAIVEHANYICEQTLTKEIELPIGTYNADKNSWTLT
jgi:hypothetical protein